MPAIDADPVRPTPPRPRIPVLLGIAVLIFLAATGAGRAASAPSDPAAIAPETVFEAAERAVVHLLARLHDDGSFVHRVNMNPSVVLKPRYNWHHHAGAALALADFQLITGETGFSQPVSRAVDDLRRRSLAPVRHLRNTMAIWTVPKVSGVRRPVTARVADAGLGLAAMVALERLKPGSVRKAELRALARFILAMQEPSGDLFSDYTPRKGGRGNSLRTLDDPGIAAVGLTAIYGLDENRAWLKGAREALLFLTEGRRNLRKVPPDAWSLIATEQLWPHLTDTERRRLEHHARIVVDSILERQVWEPDTPAYGGFAADGRTAHTAKALRGLLAAEFLFRNEPAYHAKIDLALSWGARFLLRAQVMEQGRYRGGVPRAVTRHRGQTKDAEAFNLRATEIRIDDVHHALSALVRYHAYLEAVDE